MGSSHETWPNHYWKCLEWTQEMVFNTYHHIRMHLDQKMEFDENKNEINFIFLTNFCMDFCKALFKSHFQLKSSQKNDFFRKNNCDV